VFGEEDDGSGEKFWGRDADEGEKDRGWRDWICRESWDEWFVSL
jgi:hypothetical protein